MNITPDHWLDIAKRVHLKGGSDMLVRRFLVIHFTAGASALSSISWWQDPKARGASAHFVIDRDGAIYQCRPCNKTAGHAGSSAWRDPKTKKYYTNLNSCSIGIELVNGGNVYPTKFSDIPPTKAAHKNGGSVKDWETYSSAQLAACEMLSRVLCERYNLDDVVGHDDIAPNRKVDPGPAFPMELLRKACGFEGLPRP